MITDLSLPGISGLELIFRIKQRDVNAKILVFSMHQNPGFCRAGQPRWRFGLCHQKQSAGSIVACDPRGLFGRHTLSADIAQALALEKLGTERTALETLTVREFELLRLLVEARTTEEIAQILNISPKTVANCHYLIKRKLGVSSDIELTRLAIKLNVISLLEITASAISGNEIDRSSINP